jgi:hypothetical protein
MKYDLFINGILLDTTEESISITYKVDDLTDISTKDTSYSKTIELPGTPTNNKEFGRLFEVNIANGSFDPMRAQPALLRIGDRDIIKGTLQLLEINKGNGVVSYLCQIVSQFADIISKTKDLTLSNLDFSKWDHIRNKQTIVNSWTGYGEGYVYPYISNGNEMAKQSLQTAIYDLYPAPYLKEIIDAIFVGAGYTYTSKFFNSEYFKRLILPYTEDNILMSDEKVNSRTTRVGSSGTWIGPNAVTYSDYQLFTSTHLTKGTNREFTSFKMNLETGSSNTFVWQDPLNTFDGSQYTVPGNGFYSLDILPNLVFAYYSPSNTYLWAGYQYAFRLDYRIEVVGVDGNVRTTLLNISDEAIIPSALLDTTRSGLFIDTDNNIGEAVQYAASGIWLNGGEKIRLVGRFRWPNSSNNYFGGNGSDSVIQIYPLLKHTFGSESSRFVIEPATNIDRGNELIEMSEMLSKEIKQSDLILTVAKAFNLIIDENPNKLNDLIIEPEEDYYNSGGKVLEWDSLVDEESIKIRPMSEIDANQWTWKWTDDDDYYNKHYTEETKKSYGDYSMTIENDWSDQEQKIELIFSPTPSAEEFLNGRVAPQFIERKDAEVSPKKVKPRLLFYGGLIPCNSWNITDNYGVDLDPLEQTTYPYVGMWDHPTEPRWSLEFGRSAKHYWNTSQVPNHNLFYAFHRYKMQSIQHPDSRLLEANFKLNSNIISTLDFRDKIAFDGAYWRINKIIDYDPVATEKFTKVVLLKLTNISIDSETRSIVVNAPSCPTDAIVKKGKNGRWFHFSPSGKPITQNCCSSVGGTFQNGICYVKKPNGPVKPVGENPAVGLGGVSSTPIISPSGTVATKKNGNTILTPNVQVLGSNNLVPPNVINSLIVGDNNQVIEGISESILIGSGLIADRASQLKVEWLGDKTTNTIRSTVTIEEVETLKNMAFREVLVPYTDYLIEDIGIILTSITENNFHPVGKRIQLVAKQEFYSSNGNHKGIWTPTITVSPNDTVLFGGKLWRSVTGLVGTSTSFTNLDPVNWSITGANYQESKVFGVKYDIWSDQVWEQWDEKGNLVKVEAGSARGLTTITDWLQPNRSHNKTYGMVNNINPQIYNNDISGAIYNNRNSGNIYGNRNIGEISGNTNTGNIFNNGTATSNIKNNSSPSSIFDVTASK